MDQIQQRAQQLAGNPKSIFIAYSHESEDHKQWVAALAKDLRKEGFDVVLDQDENPRPEEPDPKKDWKKYWEYRAGELNEKYVWELQRKAIFMGNIVMRPSPLPLSKLSPEWERYMDVGLVLQLIPHCRNILLINTPKYVRETSTQSGDAFAGWVLEEFQFILHSIQRPHKSPQKVISILRQGEQCITGHKNQLFPVVDFRERDTQYAESFKFLLFHLTQQPVISV